MFEKFLHVVKEVSMEFVGESLSDGENSTCIGFEARVCLEAREI